MIPTSNKPSLILPTISSLPYKINSEACVVNFESNLRAFKQGVGSFSLFSRKLIRWYRRYRRKLPWRRTKDPYKIWISEVMLAQTTVNAVIPYYERWIENFEDIRAVSRAPLHKILKSWQGLGYYDRARNIHKTSRILLKFHGGKIPSDIETLNTLPGFGSYTAAAVSSIAFGKRTPLIDANVRRLLMRLLGLKGYADTSQDKRIYAFLDEVMPQQRPGDFNQALMEVGALVCRPQGPLCGICPVRVFCKAFQKGKQEAIPAFRKRNIKKIEASVALIRNGRSYFIQKRPSGGLLADLWEFPGGKIECRETPKGALSRELKEELQCSLVSSKYLFGVRHSYTRFHVRLHVWLCKVKPPPLEDQNHKWADLSRLKRYPMTAGSVRIIEKLKAVNDL